jgi:hypothetical protein
VGSQEGQVREDEHHRPHGMASFSSRRLICRARPRCSVQGTTRLSGRPRTCARRARREPRLGTRQGSPPGGDHAERVAVETSSSADDVALLRADPGTDDTPFALQLPQQHIGLDDLENALIDLRARQIAHRCSTLCIPMCSRLRSSCSEALGVSTSTSQHLARGQAAHSSSCRPGALEGLSRVGLQHDRGVVVAAERPRAGFGLQALLSPRAYAGRDRRGGAWHGLRRVRGRRRGRYLVEGRTALGARLRSR